MLTWFGLRNEPWFPWFCCLAPLTPCPTWTWFISNCFYYIFNWTKAPSTTCTISTTPEWYQCLMLAWFGLSFIWTLISVIMLPLSPHCSSLTDIVYFIKYLYSWLKAHKTMCIIITDPRYNQCLMLTWFGLRNEPWFPWFCCLARLAASPTQTWCAPDLHPQPPKSFHHPEK